MVAITIDWEGAELSADELDVLADLRKALGAVPLTHFVSIAYVTKGSVPEASTIASIASAIQPGDELAVHLHAWRSLARASGVEPRLSPSFLTGTDDVAEFEDGDAGFDTDLDTYDVPALRAMLRTSRRLLEKTRVPVSRSFRAGGYLATPKVLLAIGDEGYTVDSSAVDYRQLDELESETLPKRMAQLWPNVEPTTQPFFVPTRGARLIEMPIAAVTDYVSVAEILRVFESAHARLQKNPDRDVFVVLAFHLETDEDYVSRLREAITKIRGRKELAHELVYATIDHAAELARFALAPTGPQHLP